MAAASAFAVLVNGLVASTLLWPEVAPASIRIVGFILAAIWWPVATLWSLRELPEVACSTDEDPHQGLFVAAQTEYLSGNWIEAEAYLKKLLRRRPRDVESLLLLATLRRRTGRFDEARQQLQQLARIEAADKWQVEIRSEREWLRRHVENERLQQIQQQIGEDSAAPPDDLPRDGERTDDEYDTISDDGRIATEPIVEVTTNENSIDTHDHRRAA